MWKSVDVLNRPIFMVPLHVVEPRVRGALLQTVEGKVRLVILGGELGEIGSVFGVVGQRLQISEVSYDYDGVRLKISDKSKSGFPRLLLLSGNVCVRNDSDAKRISRIDYGLSDRLLDTLADFLYSRNVLYKLWGWLLGAAVGWALFLLIKKL